MKKLILIAILALGMVGCTENQRARSLGGTSTIALTPNKKLVNLTWKETDLWILTRDRKEGEVPETYEFKEDSSFGVIEGTVIVKEQ